MNIKDVAGLAYTSGNTAEVRDVAKFHEIQNRQLAEIGEALRAARKKSNLQMNIKFEETFMSPMCALMLAGIFFQDFLPKCPGSHLKLTEYGAAISFSDKLNQKELIDIQSALKNKLKNIFGKQVTIE